MELRIEHLPVTSDTLDAYATVSAAIEALTRLNLAALQHPTRPHFLEEPLPDPLTLDTDLHEPPQAWAARDDLDRWLMLRAFDGPRPAGGAVLAFEPADHWFFPPQPGLAVLWDVRVARTYRRRGVGRRLLQEAGACAAEAGCHRLAIETQDVNAAACRLYASVGALLAEVRPGAYPDHPDEAAVLWHLDLRDP